MAAPGAPFRVSYSQPDPLEPNPLSLTPEPGAPGAARTWVGDVLTGWPEDRVQIARLLVSELVTNAVLHARTEILVAHSADGTRVRFEVNDRHSGGPVPKRYSRDSPTGRGMHLVASLADEWGVERDAAGKTVWFAVSRSSRAAERLVRMSERSVLDAEREDFASPGRQASPEAPLPDAVDVRVLALPLDLYLEASEHNDAVVRELTLIVQSANSPGGLEVPRRLLELAAEVRSAFAPASEGLRSQVEEVLRGGGETLDIHLSVPRSGWEALLRLADWLDEVDRYCVDGDLLTLQSSPRLRRFRRWYARQVADQMEGLPATPWERTF